MRNLKERPKDGQCKKEELIKKINKSLKNAQTGCINHLTQHSGILSRLSRTVLVNGEQLGSSTDPE